MLDEIWTEYASRDPHARGNRGAIEEILDEMIRLLDGIPRQARFVLDLADRTDRGIDQELEELLGSMQLVQPARAFLANVMERGGYTVLLDRDMQLLARRSVDASFELAEKKRNLRGGGGAVPGDLPDDVKCALYLALGLLAIFLGLPVAPSLIAMAYVMIQDDCWDMFSQKAG